MLGEAVGELESARARDVADGLHRRDVPGAFPARDRRLWAPEALGELLLRQAAAAAGLEDEISGDHYHLTIALAI